MSKLICIKIINANKKRLFILNYSFLNTFNQDIHLDVTKIIMNIQIFIVFFAYLVRTQLIVYNNLDSILHT